MCFPLWQAQTDGWLCIAFSKNGVMAQSDIMSGYVVSSGITDVANRFASSHDSPPLGLFRPFKINVLFSHDDVD